MRWSGWAWRHWHKKVQLCPPLTVHKKRYICAQMCPPVWADGTWTTTWRGAKPAHIRLGAKHHIAGSAQTTEAIYSPVELNGLHRILIFGSVLAESQAVHCDDAIYTATHSQPRLPSPRSSCFTCDMLTVWCYQWAVAILVSVHVS